MILFFYGEDNFRLKQKIRALKEKFISASLGDTNLAVLEGGGVTFEEIVRQILAMPFLSKKRLVILENLLSRGSKDVQERIADFLPKVPESTVLVFQEEGMPDRRTTLFKRLNQPGTSQEFKFLEEEQLKRWLKKEVENRKASINPEAITKLVEYVGSDLWRMTNELDKLIAYNRRLTAKNVELLVQSKIQKDIFQLIDALAQKNFPRAARELENLLQAGENELYVLTMIVYQFRNLLIIKDLEERRAIFGKWQIAKKTGLHPFVVEKTLNQTKRFTLEELKQIYRLLLDFDLAIKTGKIESRVALTLLSAKLCH